MSYTYFTIAERSKIEILLVLSFSIRRIAQTLGRAPSSVSGELDTVVSERGQAKGCVATVLERKSCWYLAIKMPNRSAASMEAAIRKLTALLPETAFQSLRQTEEKNIAVIPSLKKN